MKFDSSKYKGFLIDYSAAPSGKAYIGMAKLPLMPDNEGFGYKGVKLQSEDRKLVQCAECGKFLEAISTSHLKLHGVKSARDYKSRHGLNLQTGLVSDELSNKLSRKRYREMRHEKKEKSDNVYSIHKKSKYRGGCRPTMELRNKFETCPDQLKHGVCTYIHRFKKIPNAHSIKDGFNKEPTIRAYYGTFNSALKEWGLPTREKIPKGTVYHFPDSSIVFLKHCCPFYEYEALYELMLQKCKVLRETLTMPIPKSPNLIPAFA